MVNLAWCIKLWKVQNSMVKRSGVRCGVLLTPYKVECLHVLLFLCICSLINRVVDIWLVSLLHQPPGKSHNLGIIKVRFESAQWAVISRDIWICRGLLHQRIP